MEDINSVIDLVLRGDSNAFEVILKKYQNRGMFLAMSILKNKQDAEEVLQEAFIKSYQNLANFERRADFGTWFYRIVYNTAQTFLQRRNAKHEVFEKEDEDGEITLGMDMLSIYHQSPHDVYTQAETGQSILEAVNSLPDKIRVVVNLFYVKELSIVEIQKITSLPEGTIKTYLVKGRELLQRSLKK